MVQDALQALSEGNELIVRTTKDWLTLVFSLDQAGSLQVAPSARGPAPPEKPYCNDGGRAVMAMLAGIKRLHARARSAASGIADNPRIKLGFNT